MNSKAKNSLRSNYLAVTILTIALTVIVPPLYIFTIILWLPFRFLIITFVRLVNPQTKAAKGVGAALAALSINERVSLNWVYHLKCDGSFTIAQLRTRFHHQVLQLQDKDGNKIYHLLQCVFTSILQVLFWKEDANFDLKNHIRVYDYKEDGLALPKDSVTEEDLMRVSGPLVTQPYVAGRSPWELLLIPNFKDKNGKNLTVLTLRMHHAIADGLSCIGLIHRLFGASPPPALAKFTKPTLTDKVLRDMQLILRAPYEIAQLLIDFDDEYGTLKRPVESCADDLVALASDPIPWSSIKGIMEKYEVNSNAAVFSLIVGAIVRLVEGAGQKCPSKLSAMTAYPVPNHPGGLINHITAAKFQFDPKAHTGPSLVRQIGSQVKAANVLNPLAMVLNGCVPFIRYLPAGIVAILIRPPCTFFFTHFPGPFEALTDPNFATLLEIIPVLGPGMHGPIAVAVSTAGHLRMCVTIHKDLDLRGNGQQKRSFSDCVHSEIKAIT